MPIQNGIALTAGQKAVYDVLKQFGPVADHALVPLAQHQMQLHQSSSGIRTRRKELVSKGLVKAVGSTRTGTGRKADVFEVA